MRLSEYIKLLEEQKEKHGDITVQVQHHDKVTNPEIVGVKNDIWISGIGMPRTLVETLEPYLLVR